MADRIRLDIDVDLHLLCSLAWSWWLASKLRHILNAAGVGLGNGVLAALVRLAPCLGGHDRAAHRAAINLGHPAMGAVVIGDGYEILAGMLRHLDAQFAFARQRVAELVEDVHLSVSLG